jgi:transcriptional regulator with GAF, ATPase, and Fis domain
VKSKSQEFEKLLIELSASFINVDSEELDACINDALQRIVVFLEVERGTVGQFDPQQGNMSVTHSYAVEGIDPYSSTIGGQHVPFLIQQIRAGKPFVCDRLEDLPAAADTDKAFARTVGVKSAAAVPLAAGGITLGLVSFSILSTEKKWEKAVVRRLQLLGEIFANALLRRDKEKELKIAFAEIKQLKEHAEHENEVWRDQVISPHFEDIIGESKVLKSALQQVLQVAGTDSTVLLQGESGTGKELFATSIHNYSQRSKQPLVRVNCAALAPSLIESELFGHEKGAFTGALKTRPGRFEIADGGTIVLDEIGEFDLGLQSKLLRVIQFGEFERVGSSEIRRSDARIIASTNRSLEVMVQSGDFRQDLYYRLSVFPINVPPLRDRKQDIPRLVAYFIERMKVRLGKNITRIPQQVFDDLVLYDWPGNIRELENIIERSIIISPGTTLLLSNPVSNQKNTLALSDGSSNSITLSGQTLDEVQREQIRLVCESCQWKIDGAGNTAEILGINPNTLRSRMKKLGIARPGKT